MVIKFPGWRYGPNGEAEIFQCEADVPKGWTDNPNDFKKADDNQAAADAQHAAATGTEGDTTFDKAAAIATLKAAGVAAKGTWGEAKLKAELAKLPAA